MKLLFWPQCFIIAVANFIVSFKLVNSEVVKSTVDFGNFTRLSAVIETIPIGSTISEYSSFADNFKYLLVIQQRRYMDFD